LARRAFWRLINRLADAGTAILVTTHYLEESEQCNRLGLMVGGELVAEGAPGELKAQQTGHLLEFTVDKPQRAVDLLKTQTEPWRVALFGTRLHVITDEDAEHGTGTITKKLEANDIRVLSAREERFSMEDVFISVVEKARRQGKVAAADE
jgi:ABC-2 type transport system ATP-binding protein